MNIKIKQQVLGQIYSIYDQFTQSINTACNPGCSTCCTQNVTATTNEVYRIVQRLDAEEHSSRVQAFENIGDKLRFKPIMTTNQLADLCAAGENIPPEENHTSQAICPLLKEELCTIYPDRPFGCRCFVSSKDCRKTGCADVDSYTLTVNTLFLQFLEHIDTPGLTGNFVDTLAFFASADNTEAYENDTIHQPETFLLTNRHIPMLLVPPEHQDRIQPILSALQNIKIPQS